MCCGSLCWYQHGKTIHTSNDCVLAFDGDSLVSSPAGKDLKPSTGPAEMFVPFAVWQRASVTNLPTLHRLTLYLPMCVDQVAGQWHAQHLILGHSCY